jgi:hypothetical protein
VGGAAAIGGGVLGSGILSDTQDIPTLNDIFGRSQGYLYGILDPAQQKKLDALLALDNPTPKQLKTITDLQAKQERSSLLSQNLIAQQRYLPQYNQLALDQTKKFLPQELALQNQYGTLAAQNIRNAQMGIDPGFFAGREALGQDLQGRIGQGLSPDQLSFFGNQVNQQQAARGLFDSPLGATQTGRYLTTQDLLERQRNIQNMQGYLNSYQPQQIPQVVPFTGMPGANLAGGALTPPSFGDVASLRASLLGAKFGQNTMQAGQLGNAIGGGLSGLSSSMFSIAGMGGIPGGSPGGSPSAGSNFGASNSIYGGMPYWNSNPFSTNLSLGGGY